MTQQMHPSSPQTHVPANGTAPAGAYPPPALPGWLSPQYPPPPAPAPPRRSRGRLVGAIAGGLVAVAGLGTGALLLFGTATLDTDELTDRIAEATQQQSGVAPTALECPADVEVAAGATFGCTAELEGQPVSFTVEQTDDEGNVRFDLDTPFVVVSVVESSVAEQVAADYAVDVTASCETGGRSVLVDAVGDPVPCTVTNVDDAADSLAVVATVAEDGTVSYVEA
ncbi:DUF4333 domain-containing protein [Modestobacter versicolor]|uniref:DUF4333 domain-containing protein n=1 Tax=Modestobacter versicolor TaxID=429133 RepID=UPI0034DF61BB